MSSLRWALLLSALTLIGAFLRLYQIGRLPLWVDEAFSVWVGSKPLGEIVRVLIDVDTAPPLHYFLLHFWIRLGGDGEVWVRALSAVAGILTIPVIYLIGKRLVGTSVGLLSALLLAISPFHIQFAQEARMYAPMTLFAASAMAMTAILVTEPASHQSRIGTQLWRRLYRRQGQGNPPAVHSDLAWLGYILTTALAMYCHSTAIFLPLGLNLFILGLMIARRFRPGSLCHLQPPSLINWIIAQVGVLLLFAPWLPAYYLQSQGVADQFWITTPTTTQVINALKTFLMAHLPVRMPLKQMIWGGYWLLVLLSIVHFRKQPARLAFLAVMFLTPVLGELLISLKTPIFYDRTLIWSTIPLYVALAAGIRQLRYRWFMATAVLIIAATAILSAGNYYTFAEKERWDQAASYVGENVQPGDIMLFNAGWVQIPFDYYYRKYQYPLALEEYGVPATLFEAGILEPHMTVEDLPRLRELIKGRQRVWLVYSHNWWTDAHSLIPNELRQQMRLVSTRRFPEIQVNLYTAEK